MTERARKLRAQYALQAQGLRARLEMRINRIPQSLRKTNMQDLLDKYTHQQQQQQKPPAQPTALRVASPAPAASKGVKRSRYAQSTYTSTTHPL